MTRRTCLAIHPRKTICFALAALGYGRKTEEGRIESTLENLTDDNAEEVEDYVMTALNLDDD